MPRATPIMSAIQSFISALRLKVGWMISITPPKTLAPTNTGSKPKRPVLERGKESAAKAKRCTSLSLPSGAGGGASSGQSIATVRMIVTISVRGISRYLRIIRGYWSHRLNATSGYKNEVLLEKWKMVDFQGFVGFDKKVLSAESSKLLVGRLNYFIVYFEIVPYAN